MTTLLAVIAITLAVSFACSVMEAVLLSVSHGHLGVMRERGSRAGEILSRMREDIDEPIAAILTLNTISHTVGAALAGAIALQVLGNQWMALFSALLTFAILILSEIIPKTLGAVYYKQLAAPVAHALRWMIVVLKPVLIPLKLLGRLMTRGRKDPRISRAEIEVLASIGRQEGTLDENEWQVMTNIMHLDQITAEMVMTPRTAIVAIPIEATVAEAKAVMLAEGHLRLPVYEGSIDRVVGILLARELWRAEAHGLSRVREIVRTPMFVPESKPVERLIVEMRQQRVKMAIVLDEFGGTAGLVTLEDLLEEIVGEIQDEHEVEPPDFVEVDGRVLIDGAVPVWALNERYGTQVPEDEYDTVGGFVFGEIGRIPTVGDEIESPWGTFRVDIMDERRVARVAFTPRPEVPTEP